MNSKQGKISLLVQILVLTLTVWVIWNFIGPGTNKAFASILPFLMSEEDRKILEEEQEKEREEQEKLLGSLENLKNDFGDRIKDCISSGNTECTCVGPVDFTKLGEFSVMVTSTKEGTTFNNQIELLDKSQVSLPNKAPENLGNFIILPENKYDKLDDYIKNDHGLRFSSKELRLRTGTKNPKVTDKVDNIFFGKPERGVITIHDDGDPYVGSLCG